MRIASLALLCGMGLLYAAPAHALGNRVLVYQGNGGSYVTSGRATRMDSQLRAAGAAGVDYRSSWVGRTVLNRDYRLLLLSPHSTQYNSTLVNDIRNFIGNGGRVVLIGEGHGFRTQNNNINYLAGQFSVPMRASASSSGAGGCGVASRTTSSHPISSGSATTIRQGYAAIISGGTPLYNRGGVLAAVSGNVLMVTDSNVWTDGSCVSGSSNDAFFRNLWSAWSCVPRTWYRDADGDTWGGGSTTSACTAPSGYVARTGDCDDGDRLTFPGASEIIGDGKDQSCDGRETCYVNDDADPYRLNTTVASSDADCLDAGEALASLPAVDCDDSDPAVYPGATEIIGDDTDQDCDGGEICFADGDDDGYRITSTVTSSDDDCSDAGEASVGEPAGDCDDADALTYPGATEIVADGKDQSCDGTEICHVNADGDGYRLFTTITSSDEDCSDPGEALATVPTLDCDDTDPLTYPGAPEIVGDGKDQSCDGSETCFVDADNDGWRLETTVVSSDADCTDSGEATASDPTLDCDDDDAATYPGAPEVAYDGKDQDCDGDDLCDVDLDGFDASVGFCTGSDCDDDDALINPSVDEVWYDGVDSDCDAWSDYDADFDGHDSSDYGGDDCDDTDDAINPSAEEIWYDGIDSDCDGASDYDADGDGYDSADYGGEDCDDDNDQVYPGAEELEDGIDNDCNGVDEDDDTDGDGVPDEVELELGTDPENPDSDGDGVWDRVEIGPDDEAALDTDGDGTIDALDTDDDGDGISTEDETAGTEDGSPLGDYADDDGDGVPNFRDDDSDGDGFSDADEGDVDTDGDGVLDYLDPDSDGDGIADENELDADTDGDGAEDRVDPDDDGDSIPTEVEGDGDTDGDGTPDYLDPDSDDDGIDDATEGMGDADCDEVLNYVDANDVDGPCGDIASLSSTYQSGACGGASTSATGLLGFLPIGFAFIGLLGLRRRREQR